MLRWIIAVVIVLALPEPAQGQGPDLDWVQRHAVSEEGKLLETYVSDDIGDVLSFAFDPFTPDRLLAAEYPDTYLLETVDGGQTWQRTYLQGGVITPAFAPSDPSIIYLTGGMRRVWKSDDGGASWTLLATKPFESSWLVGVAVSPVDPDIVVVASSGIVTPGPGGMYLTTDGGETWSNRATGFEHWSNNVVFSQSHPDIVFATQANGSYPLFWSDDSGYTWQQISEANQTYTFLHVSRGDPDFLYFGRRGASRGLYRGPVTTQEWEQVHLGGYYPKGGVFLQHVATDPETPSRIAVALTSGIILSEDDGASWSQISLRVARQIAFDPHRPNRLWMAGGIGADYGIEPLDLDGVDTEGGPERAQPVFTVYPNPARDHVTISFEAPAGEPVTVRVYDLLGREVARVVDVRPATGSWEEVVFRPGAYGLAAANYLVTLSTSTSRDVRLVTILGR